ncbi:unnamed protein product [Strongylus vulgaris]|uniref:Uncharacterized protein n=1 Tax=Strongylus vulgaris TaxID=40348 RepID=A0A3P7IYZ7_STRVU|nr:unnamed protein product [Strongylus vulgaris]
MTIIKIAEIAVTEIRMANVQTEVGRERTATMI